MKWLAFLKLKTKRIKVFIMKHSLFKYHVRQRDSLLSRTATFRSVSATPHPWNLCLIFFCLINFFYFQLPVQLLFQVTAKGCILTEEQLNQIKSINRWPKDTFNVGREMWNFTNHQMSSISPTIFNLDKNKRC